MILKVLLFIGAALSILLLSFGGLLLFKKMKYDMSATADVNQVTCQDGTGKCNITMTFKDTKDKTYTVSAIVAGQVAPGSTRGIMYDSTNPNNFYPGQPPVRIIGAGLFMTGIVIALGCIIGAYFMFRTPPPPSVEPVTTMSADSPYSNDNTPEQSQSPPSTERDWYEPSPEEVRAKQFADEKVVEVTEPARRTLF